MSYGSVEGAMAEADGAVAGFDAHSVASPLSTPNAHTPAVVVHSSSSSRARDSTHRAQRAWSRPRLVGAFALVAGAFAAVSYSNGAREWDKSALSESPASLAASLAEDDDGAGDAKKKEEKKKKIEKANGSSKPTSTGSDDDDTAYEVTLTQADFFDFPRVEEWLHLKGLNKHSPTAELDPYIPTKIVVRGKPNLIKGSNYSDDVMAGLTTFAIAYDNSTASEGNDRLSSSFTMVIDMYGNIVSLAPTMHDLQDGGLHANDYHFIAFKPYELDPSYMMGVVDSGTTEYGPAYLWNWKEDKAKKYVPLMDGNMYINCHDIQVRMRKNETSDAFWVPKTSPSRDGIELVGQDGTTVMSYLWNLDYVSDPNHVQLIEEDTVAIVSSRITNSVLRIRLGTSARDSVIEWIMNGHNSTVELYDEFGTLYKGGNSPDWLFESQHNAEYMGDDLIYLVDDTERDTALGKGITSSKLNASSVMIIRVKNSTESGDYVGRVVWRYDIDAQAFVEEITMDKEVAWSAHIYGNNTMKGGQGMEGDVMAGWRIYSAERFYERPTISHITCDDSAAKNAWVTFKVHNNFRENNLKPGSYSVTSSNGDHTTSGTFNFHPYWSDNDLEVSVKGANVECDGLVIEVTNHFDQSTSKTVKG